MGAASRQRRLVRAFLVASRNDDLDALAAQPALLDGGPGLVGMSNGGMSVAFRDRHGTS